MILVDAQEFTAVDRPAFLSVNQTFPAPVLLKFIVPDVKIYTTLDPSIKAVSFSMATFLQFLQMHI